MAIFIKPIVVFAGFFLALNFSHTLVLANSVKVITEKNVHLIPRSEEDREAEFFDFKKNWKNKKLTFQGKINRSGGLSLDAYYVNGCDAALRGMKLGTLVNVTGNLVSRESGGSGGEPIELNNCNITQDDITSLQQRKTESKNKNIKSKEEDTSFKKQEQAIENKEEQIRQASLIKNSRAEVTAENASKSSPHNKSAAPRSESIFNLKGFHLNMTRDDVKRLISNAKFDKVTIYDGKELSGYQCGVVAQQHSNSCGFSYAGEEITGITVSFWGDFAFEIQLYFGEFRPNKHSSATVYLDRKMRAALDSKYNKESNTTGPNGNLGSLWRSGSELMRFEYVKDKNFYSNSLSLVDIKYRNEFLAAKDQYEALKKQSEKQKNDKKVLSDM